jgi:hypothetical protein
MQNQAVELANALLDIMEQKEAYTQQEAIEMLDVMYGILCTVADRKPLSERQPELVGKVVGGGNKKEDLE